MAESFEQERESKHSDNLYAKATLFHEPDQLSV